MNTLPTKSYYRKESYLLFGITGLYLFVFFIAFIDRFLIFYLLTGQEYFNPIDLPRKVNLTLFATISKVKILSMPVIGNILSFLPFGIFIKLYFPNIRKYISGMICLLFPFCIELAQYILATGSLDIDDYVLNVCGMFLGLLIYCGIFFLCKKNPNTTKTLFINTILIFPPFLFTCIRCLLSDKSEAHLKPLDLTITGIYLIVVLLLLKGAAKWQYIYILTAIILWGTFFYTIFISWI